MKNRKLIIDTVAVITSLILMIVAYILPEGELATFLWIFAFIIGGASKAIEGVTKTIQLKSLNVEFLMIAAALASFFTQNYSEGSTLIFIFALSGVLEEYALQKSEKALTSLLKVTPKTAILLSDGKEIIVPIEQLKINDEVVVKVGQQSPSDGILIKGETSFNQAALTGEFVPVPKALGSEIFAGAINVDSTVVVRVTKNPSDSLVQKMIDFVKSAQEAKTKSETRVNSFERWYVYLVILISLSVMFIPLLLIMQWDPEVWKESFRRGVIVLVVASPCALVASITPAILSSLSNAARHGILIKSGEYLEKLQGIKAVVFDKTGTITKGVPQVVDMQHLGVCARTNFIQLVVTMERHSNHPLAKAIANHYKDVPSLEIETKEVPGKGMQAVYDNHEWRIGRFPHELSSSMVQLKDEAQSKGQTVVEIVRDNQLVGFIALKDTVREGISNVMEALANQGIYTLMLTGDNEKTAQSIASEVKIAGFKANCLPEDKVTHVKALRASKGPVMMIGDGINDAPSLAFADVGVAMGDGTDVSLETADLVMMNNNLANIPYVLKLSHRMKRIINQNVIFSISVIALLLISNLFGQIQLPIGVVAHETSTILVILNSLRLLISRK